jgi:predicted nucleic acid-binding protein
LTRVVDASVAVKWFLDEPLREPARTLVASGEELLAPDLLIVEVANVLWKRSRRGEIEPGQALRGLKTLVTGIPVLFRGTGLVGEAFALAARLDHPVYDCLYLALAVQEDTRVVTADRRLAEAVAGTDLQERVEVLSAG